MPPRSLLKLALLLGLLVAASTSAVAEQLPIRTNTTADGLASDSVYRVVADVGRAVSPQPPSRGRSTPIRCREARRRVDVERDQLSARDARRFALVRNERRTIPSR